MSIEQINDEKLKNENRYHSCLKDVPDLSATDMKEFFDYVSRRVIIPKINELIDDRTNIDESLATKADADSVYTKPQTDVLLAKKADKTYTYTRSDTDLLLSGKADADNVYTKAECDARLSEKPSKEDVILAEESADFLSSYLNQYEYEDPFVYDRIITENNGYEFFSSPDCENYSGLLRTGGEIWIKQRLENAEQPMPASGRFIDWFTGPVRCSCTDTDALKSALGNGTFMTVYLDGKEAAWFNYDASDGFIKIVVPDFADDYIHPDEWIDGRAFPFKDFIVFKPDELERLTFTFNSESARATFEDKLPSEVVRLLSLARRSELENVSFYNGTMKDRFTQFSQCTKDGFYDCPATYISSVTDKPDGLNTACICMVFNAVSSMARYMFVADIAGGVWLKNPYNAQWMNITYNNAYMYMYRGEVPVSVGDDGVSVSSFAQCTKNGHYDFRTVNVGYITDKPDNLKKAGIISVEISTVLGFVKQTVTDLDGNTWRRTVFSGTASAWKEI